MNLSIYLSFQSFEIHAFLISFLSVSKDIFWFGAYFSIHFCPPSKWAPANVRSTLCLLSLCWQQKTYSVQGQVGLFIVISRMNSLRSGSYHEPDYSMALARIQHMNKDELNELLNNEAKMDDYIKSLDQVKISSNWSGNKLLTWILILYRSRICITRKKSLWWPTNPWQNIIFHKSHTWLPKEQNWRKSIEKQ